MSQQTKSRKAMKQRKKNNKKITWKKVLLALLILAVLSVFIVVGVVYSYIKDAPPLNAEELKVPLSTTILDRNGDVVAELGVEKRKEIEFDDIPDVLKNAVLATEDVRFFEHSGIDFLRMGAAVIANITDGFGAQGASTITQQVVKNAFLTHDKKMKRKIQEQYLAIQLEREYSKEQIFTMYLNQIHYGKNIYGVQKASEAFFGKSDLHDLTLAEAALLAGIPQRPNAYNPFNDTELAEQRRNTVLDLMVRHEKISEQEAEEAKQVKVEDMVRGDYITGTPYDSFIEQVVIEAEELLEDEELDLGSAGLTIHTTLDPEAQDYIEHLLSEESPVEYPEDIEAGIVLLDTKTGEILAIGGGRNKAQGIGASMNYALNPYGRQPGSAIKPIVDFGPVIEYLNWSTYEQILDEPYSYEDDPDKIISNAGRGYFGEVSLREATYRSLNVPAVKMFHELGSSQPSEFARRLGLEFDGDLYESDAIGGGKIQVNPLEMAGAYAAFGNGGIYNEPYSITKIVFPDETEIEVKHDAVVAMADYTAYMVTDMLKDVLKNPAGTAYHNTPVGNLPVAGKTGTTNRGDNMTPDSWMAGYTTNFTVAVWSGYSEEQHIEGQYQRIPQHIFSYIMNHMSEGIETPDFVMPDSVVEVQIEKGSNPPQLPSDYTPSDQIVTELFVKGTEPTETSDQFDEMETVIDVSVDYDEDNETIHLAWDHPRLNDDDEEEILFELSLSIDDDNFRSLDTLSETEFTLSNITKGSTYTFEIVAVHASNEDLRSEAVQASIDIPEDEPEDIEEELPEDPPEDPEPNDPPNDNGNGNDDEDNDEDEDDTEDDEDEDDDEDNDEYIEDPEES